MCSMCHYCGAQLTKSEDGKRKPANENFLKINGEKHSWSCRFCLEKHEQENIKRDIFSTASPMISPTTSLSSSDRSVSSCSDFSVDINLYDRGSQEEGTAERAQEEVGYGWLNGQPHKSSPEVPVNGVNKLTENNSDGSHNGSFRDIEIMQTVNGQESKDHSGDYEMDAQVWEPPEAEDPEDDLEGSIAFNDDDDECGDGTKWGKPSSLSCCKDEGNGSYQFKVEQQKAMEEVANGKFKAIVSQLLKTANAASMGMDCESWVDIVSRLSWEAASFFKPDAIDGKGMHLNGYVKVKCIATGSCSESQIFKGLVFKKHAAHKHMPTDYKNPRLLLIRGVLGHSSSGLSSFKSMDQEKDNLKLLMDMLDVCHPNVILVEKSVSRDVQESILAKGMTLVYDMKLHRLERIARCTASPILSSDTLAGQKLKQCESFRIEKFMEEHAGLGEGGKKPSKTLMFIEGCPTHLGCTILLKGSHSDELKKIKYVVQIAVVMAYYLILETSFLVDWKAMFSTVLLPGPAHMSPRDHNSSILETGDSINHCVQQSIVETEPSTVDIPISDGICESGSHNINMGLEGNFTSYVPYNPVVFSGFSSLSASFKKVLGDNFPLVSSVPCQSLANYFGFNGKETNGQSTEEVSVLKTSQASEYCDMESKNGCDDEKSFDNGQPQSLMTFSKPVDGGKDVDNQDGQAQSKDDVNAVFDSQSILVLMSRRNALRWTVCEQSHFSHIMFYRNFDVPLGKYLQDNLLNQRHQCTTCGQFPEAHISYYAHHRKQLTIQVKRLLKFLPGEAEGKLWMWSCCGKCKHKNGVQKCTKRVLISTAARCLSFGKFLELSFSHHSSFGGLSYCGHSLEDFLYFFGLGPMAAMFKFSSFTTYAVSLPPQKLEFSPSIRYDELKREFKNVYSKGILLFNGITDTLKKLKSQFEDSTLNLHGSLEEFSCIEDMLKKETSAFEASIISAVAKNGNAEKADHKFLNLNRLLWELLLESCIWERRLHSLLMRDPSLVRIGAIEKPVHSQLKSKMSGTTDERNEETEIVLRNDIGNSKDMLGKSVETNEFSVEEIPTDGLVLESRVQDHLAESSNFAEDVERSIVAGLSQNRSPSLELSVTLNGSSHQHSGDSTIQADDIAFSGDLEVERTIPIVADIGDNDSIIDSDGSRKGTSLHSLVSGLENSTGWFWMPFSEICQIYMEDLERGFMPKFQSVSSYIQEHISAAHQLITEEGQRLHIPLGADNYIVRDYDGELSSIIACALAVLKDIPVSLEVVNDGQKEGGMSAKSTDSSHFLTRIPTRISSHWSSSGSDSDSFHSTLSVSPEELHFSSFDGFNLLESLVPPENVSPEVSLGVAKSLGKGKYSVICLYAKQFRDLRSRCCLSEMDYISSLSRCKNWDAKGGKSKSFFAKTLDDRFIIKEIKKTEFESFVKFAHHYFKYMNESFELGNQTCLAKVLGIYQVTLRQAKSGKEMRHDLMVMENLSFGRNITRQYDLKGALHARYNSAADGSGDVLLDQNFVNDMNSSPLYVSNKAKRLLERAVWNDTTFLNSINVMDYSLLVGVDTRRQELVCGIIDYLRQYTWDKQLETWVKSSLVVPKNLLPTVISPKEYKKRFRKFMATHFLSVPDNWCSQRPSDLCELCGIRDNVSP